jgi:hypothetical protein
MENIKWHCALELLLQWLGPAGTERTQPILTFWPEGKTGDSFPPPPFTGVALLVNFG